MQRGQKTHDLPFSEEYCKIQLLAFTLSTFSGGNYPELPCTPVGMGERWKAIREYKAA